MSSRWRGTGLFDRPGVIELPDGGNTFRLPCLRGSSSGEKKFVRMSSAPSAALSGPNCEGVETSTPESNWSICLHMMPLLHLLCQRSDSGPSLLASSFCSGLFSMAISFLTTFSAAGYLENSHARHSSRVRMYPG